MGGQEQAYVADAFATNWIAPLGPHVDGFEHDLCSFTGAGYAAALTSGTAALHLALVLSGVQAGHEVLCQSFTFSASANPIAYLGAHPVFIDSEPDTWNMSPAALRQAIQERREAGADLKAVVLVHLYGMPAKVGEIKAICQQESLVLIEDAAEALGSTYKGRPCGTFGQFGVLSFNGNKIITTSGGGALLSDNEVAIQKARFLATQARDPAPHYQHSHIGYNYRLSNVLAGIGRGQMEVLPLRVEQRRSVFAFYADRFKDIAGVSFQYEGADSFSNRWLSCLLIDPALTGGITREHIRLHLDKQNIESRPLWKPMHMQPIFAQAPFVGDGTAERLFANGLCLPSGSNLSDEDLERVATAVEEAFTLIPAAI